MRPRCTYPYTVFTSISSHASSSLAVRSFSLNAPAQKAGLTVPGVDEIQMVDVSNPSGKTYLFMHAMKDGTLDNSLFYHLTSGNVSPDGKFAIWNTDWEGQLGQASTCNSPLSGGSCTAGTTTFYRDDVIVTELR